ncbi:transmembrane protein 242-like [Actinia tenebrosa]|uniref:Transmembrane protein 242 n=1 Tax=Actinia tenebrosa TaxID=6105 RepID=A0A6P8IUH5_ACTTE|nr:transmembrane protein 242-like [Actinia tenebrosa]
MGNWSHKSKMADEQPGDDSSNKKSVISDSEQESPRVSLTSAALLLTGVTVASMMGGFGVTLGMARKKSPDAFTGRYNEGVKLATRALAYGSLWAIGGVGVIVYGVKTALGVKTTKEFGAKMTEILPSKDGKLVTYFESWRLPRKQGSDDKEVESWFADKPMIQKYNKTQEKDNT